MVQLIPSILINNLEVGFHAVNVSTIDFFRPERLVATQTRCANNPFIERLSQRLLMPRTT
jgi:hypothetical protein